MEPDKKEPKKPPAPHKQEKRRKGFQIVKLEERIAPSTSGPPTTDMAPSSKILRDYGGAVFYC